jgi:hypothetical protein
VSQRSRHGAGAECRRNRAGDDENTTSAASARDGQHESRRRPG